MSTFGGVLLPEDTVTDAFTEFVEMAEPRLRRALCAAFGREAGLEATAEALAFSWEHWELVRRKENPVGFLWGVGRNKARAARRPMAFPPVAASELPWVEPKLPEAFGQLSEKQRLAVIMVHGYGWTLSEVAELVGVSKSTVQKHLERALARLRKVMGVDQ